MLNFRRLATFALLLGPTALSANADPLLNPLFQDHAVLQRDAPIKLWGSATPDARVTATLGNTSVTTKADKTGRWQANLPPLTAGGPYNLKVVSGTQSQSLTDVLIGDVYLCSGQSNMAFRVAEAIDAGPEIQASANDTIRLLSIANNTKPSPQSALPAPASWSPASPQKVSGFSAACYFFARDLQNSVHVPLGLIQSAWPGANISAFMSASALYKAGGNDARLDALKRYAQDPKAGIAQWGTVIENFWKAKGVTPWSDPKASAAWAVAPKDLGIWTQWGVPALAHYAGHVWFRTSVNLTATQAAQAKEIGLGTITEEDQTWINGKWLAGSFGYGEARNYALPDGALHEGDNDIFLNVYCGWKGCGLFGPAEARAITLKDGTHVPLNGPWKYEIVPAAFGTAPRVPWGATAGITMAYNAMIAPLGPYGMKGVLWYQGESNTGDAAGYKTVLKAWMADWRQLFANPTLPFLIVQLPDYGLPPFAPQDTDWARLRESQRLAVNADPHAALAVTIDIGDHMGLHPANKQEVGRRLALAARRLIYNDTSLKSGPVPKSAVISADHVTIAFTGINGVLKSVGGDAPIGFELCGTTQASCRFVSATIKGETVALTIPSGLTPTRVRYCWGDGPVCTLYDESRIPSVPFEMTLGAAP